MPLQPGTTLGPYSVTAKIGEGGMGEVYRARDTKLDRDVALKVLPEAFTQDPDRLARFEREAKVLASLNHPNIGHIYGLEEADGVRALVLELVEGPTLADRIKQGPIPIDEALPIAKQIAEALEAAHEQRIIHRDLKPANIKVKDDGTVKVLDFGLAKALDPSPTGDPSESPTLTAAATEMGVVLGTAAYMSPEQASGETADKRSDIWSFGVVLFEMLTGQRLFTGKTVAHVMAKVLDRDLDLTVLPTTTPAPIRRLLRRCLEREQKRRLRDVGEALSDLEEAATAPTVDASVAASVAPVTQPTGWRQVLPLAAALVAGGIITGIAVWTLTRAAPATLHVTRFTLPTVSVTFSNHFRIALSPDGTRLAYAGIDQLYLRSMDQIEATPLPRTEGAVEPFFSPDGQWLGFWADGQLKKISVTGGAPVALCDCSEPFGVGWGPDDTILFGSREGVWRVPGDGGTPELVIPTEDDEGGIAHPQYLPGGEWILFRVVPSSQVAVQSLVTGERQMLIENGGDVRYLPTGHLAHVLDGTLLAVPFDVEKRAITGGPVPLVEGIDQDPTSRFAHYAHADDGTLVYYTGYTHAAASRMLVLVDRNGQEELIPIPPRAYSQPQFSPDGRRVIVDTIGGDNELFLYDLETQVEEQFTFEPTARDQWPLWTTDGSQIVFSSDRHQGFP